MKARHWIGCHCWLVARRCTQLHWDWIIVWQWQAETNRWLYMMIEAMNSHLRRFHTVAHVFILIDFILCCPRPCPCDLMAFRMTKQIAIKWMNMLRMNLFIGGEKKINSLDQWSVPRSAYWHLLLIYHFTLSSPHHPQHSPCSDVLPFFGSISSAAKSISISHLWCPLNVKLFLIESQWPRVLSRSNSISYEFISF